MENETKMKGRKATFMLVVFFIRKAKKPGQDEGDLYSIAEIEAKENRKQFDSYDTHPGKMGVMIRNEQIGYTKLLNFIEKIKGNCYSGYMLAVKADKKLFTYGKDGIKKHLSFPEFSRPDSKTKEVICIGCENTTPVQAPATKKEFIPLYSNKNSPEKDKFYKRVELYEQSTKKDHNTNTIGSLLSTHLKHLRTNGNEHNDNGKI